MALRFNYDEDWRSVELECPTSMAVSASSMVGVDIMLAFMSSAEDYTVHSGGEI
jgi:hypothetical protein